jgi:hypothetical protein
MKRNLLATILAAASAAGALAQKLPSIPGPQPGNEDRIAQPSFDCGNREPQPIGDNMTMQAVFGPLMWEDPNQSHIGKFNVCITPRPSPPEIACMLFALPSGQRVAVPFGPITVIEGAPLAPTQYKRLQQIGYGKILACNNAIRNAATCKSQKWTQIGTCVK